MVEVGEVEALYRFPVKSMRGEALEAAELDWHGLVGDRRLALRRLDDNGGFPWLTAGNLPELLTFTPMAAGESGGAGALPTHVRTPDGRELPIFGEELAAEIAGRWGRPVQVMRMKHGVPDEGAVSVISWSTVTALASLVSQPPDVRRYRPNVLIRSLRGAAFEEDGWVGGTLVFGNGGDGDGAPAIAVTLRDERCAMVNIDPDSAARDPALHKLIVRTRDNLVGVYATVTRLGRLHVGQRVYFAAAR